MRGACFGGTNFDLQAGQIGGFFKDAMFDLGRLRAFLPVGIFKLDDTDHVFGGVVAAAACTAARTGIDGIEPVFAFMLGVKAKNAILNFL